MQTDGYILTLVKRHAAEGKFARIERNVPGAANSDVFIMPEGGTVFATRYRLPVPLQDTESGRDVLALDRRDRARFVLAAFDLIIAQRQKRKESGSRRHDTWGLEKAIERLLKGRVEWKPEEIAGLAETCLANYEPILIELSIRIYGHIRRFDLLTCAGGEKIRRAAHELEQQVEEEPYWSPASFKRLRQLLNDIAGHGQVIDFVARRG